MVKFNFYRNFVSEITIFSIHARNLMGAMMIALLFSVLAGCGGSDGDDDTVDEKAITVTFKALVNGQNFVCGQTYSNIGIGLPGTYRVNDWRFYVHDVALVKADGSRRLMALNQDGVWQYQNLAMLDLENGCANGTPQTNATVKGTVPNESYTGICFKLGIPYALNHLSDATAPSPLNSSGMMWNWRGGRKFIRIDGVGDPGNINQAFHIHLGSTECPGTAPNAPPTAACGYPNVPEFCLDNFNVERDQIAMNLEKALEGSNVVVNSPGTQAGCMSANSDPDCIEIMPRLNLNFTYSAGAGIPPQSYPKLDPPRLFSVLKP